MVSYIYTISSRTHDITNLITDDRLMSLGYIGERQSIGVPHSTLGGVLVTMPPPSTAAPTSDVGAGPSQATAAAPPESGDEAQERATNFEGRAGRDKTPEDGDDTESNRGFEQDIFLERETLQDTSSSATVPASERE